jgi:hypothetical protein
MGVDWVKVIHGGPSVFAARTEEQNAEHGGEQEKRMKRKTRERKGAAAAAEPAKGDGQNLPETEAEAEARREQVRARAVLEHTTGVTVSLYGHLLRDVVGKDATLNKSVMPYVADLWARFSPRDPVEELLLSQMIQTHARLMYLNAFAQQQKHIKWAAMMHEAADRAANTFRRQMLALAEYRRPPRPKSFTAIGQANIAQQQIVQNGGVGAGQNGNSENETATNEKGSTPRPALPADGGGAGVAARLDPALQALRSAEAMRQRAEGWGALRLLRLMERAEAEEGLSHGPCSSARW